MISNNNMQNSYNRSQASNSSAIFSCSRWPWRPTRLSRWTDPSPISSGNDCDSLLLKPWPSRYVASFPMNSMLDLSTSLCKRLSLRVTVGMFPIENWSDPIQQSSLQLLRKTVTQAPIFGRIATPTQRVPGCRSRLVFWKNSVFWVVCVSHVQSPFGRFFVSFCIYSCCPPVLKWSSVHVGTSITSVTGVTYLDGRLSHQGVNPLSGDILSRGPNNFESDWQGHLLSGQPC